MKFVKVKLWSSLHLLQNFFFQNFACDNLFGAQWELIREQNKPIGNRTTTKTLIRTLEMCFESL